MLRLTWGIYQNVCDIMYCYWWSWCPDRKTAHLIGQLKDTVANITPLKQSNGFPQPLNSARWLLVRLSHVSPCAATCPLTETSLSIARFGIAACWAARLGAFGSRARLGAASLRAAIWHLAWFGSIFHAGSAVAAAGRALVSGRLIPWTLLRAGVTARYCTFPRLLLVQVGLGVPGTNLLPRILPGAASYRLVPRNLAGRLLAAACLWTACAAVGKDDRGLGWVVRLVARWRVQRGKELLLVQVSGVTAALLASPVMWQRLWALLPGANGPSPHLILEAWFRLLLRCALGGQNCGRVLWFHRLRVRFGNVFQGQRICLLAGGGCAQCWAACADIWFGVFAGRLSTGGCAARKGTRLAIFTCWVLNACIGGHRIAGGIGNFLRCFCTCCIALPWHLLSPQCQFHSLLNICFILLISSLVALPAGLARCLAQPLWGIVRVFVAHPGFPIDPPPPSQPQSSPPSMWSRPGSPNRKLLIFRAFIRKLLQAEASPAAMRLQYVLFLADSFLRGHKRSCWCCCQHQDEEEATAVSHAGTLENISQVQVHYDLRQRKSKDKPAHHQRRWEARNCDRADDAFVYR